jgi:hypothetical protein
MEFGCFQKGCGEKEMAHAQIEITFDDVEEKGGVPSLDPKQILKGSVQVTPDKDIDCRHLYARLNWHTEGRGNRDEGTAIKLDLYQGALRAGIPSHHAFQFPIPASPWSYSGRYVSIVWELKITIDIPWKSDPVLRVPLIMAPQAA